MVNGTTVADLLLLMYSSVSKKTIIKIISNHSKEVSVQYLCMCFGGVMLKRTLGLCCFENLSFNPVNFDWFNSHKNS